MQPALGRLVIARKSGESFFIGDLAVTLTRHTHNMTAEMDLEFPNGSGKTILVNDRQTIDLGNHITVCLTIDTGRGDRITVTIVAPKHIKILRSELVREEDTFQRG